MENQNLQIINSGPQSPDNSMRHGAALRQKLFEQYDICDISHKYSIQESIISQEKDFGEEVNLTQNSHFQQQQQQQQQSLKYLQIPNIIRKQKSQDVTSTLNNIQSPLPAQQKIRAQTEIFSFSQLEQNKNQQLSGNEQKIAIKEQSQICILPLDKKVTNNESVKGQQLQLGNGFQSKWQGGRCFFILRLILKFIKHIKNYSNSYKFSQMMSNHFQIISDHSADKKYYKENNYLVKQRPSLFHKLFRAISLKMMHLLPLRVLQQSIFRKVISIITDNLIIIQPDSFMKVIWDSFILFLLLINIFYIPIKLVFEYDDGLVLSRFLEIFLNDLPGWAFLIDIILNFNTAYYSKGVIISKRSKIFKHYLKTNFFWDSIVVVPFIISLKLRIPFMDSVLLLRTNKMRKIAQSFEQMLNMRQDHYAIYELFKLILTILFIAHFFGCAYYYFSNYLMDNANEFTWIQAQKIENEQWFVKYSFSLYWAVVTMVTIGYGDITPINYMEKLFVVGISLLGCGVFAYSLNSIGTIVQDLTKRNTQFNAKMAQLSALMKKKNLSGQLQIKVKKYFEYLHKEQLEDNCGQDMLINQLASTLRKEVLTEIYSKVLLSTKIFKMNFSESFLYSLAPKLKEKRFGPEEIIYSSVDCALSMAKEGTYDRGQGGYNNQNSALFFLMRGDAEIFINLKSLSTSQTVLYNLHKGEIFGEDSFFTQTPSPFSIRSVNVVTMVYLSFEDFIDVLKLYPLDWQQYCMIRDNLSMYKCYDQINMKCRSCNQFGHKILECPLLNPTIRKDKLIYRSCISAPQERVEHFERKDRISFSPYLDIHIMKECAMAWIVQNNQMKSFDDLVAEIQFLDDQQSKIQENSVLFDDDQFNKKDKQSSSSDSEDSEDNKSQQGNNMRKKSMHSLTSQKTSKIDQKVCSFNSIEEEQTPAQAEKSIFLTKNNSDQLLYQNQNSPLKITSSHYMEKVNVEQSSDNLVSNKTSKLNLEIDNSKSQKQVFFESESQNPPSNSNKQISSMNAVRDQQRKGSLLICQQRKPSFRGSLSLSDKSDLQQQLQALQAKEKEKEASLQINNRKSVAILQKFQSAVIKKKSADISASNNIIVGSNNNTEITNQKSVQFFPHNKESTFKFVNSDDEIQDEQDKEKQQYNIMPNFDSYQSYKKYFVYNNIDVVLQNYNKLKKGRSKNKKKQLTHKEQALLHSYISKLKENFNKNNYKNLRNQNLANELKNISNNSGVNKSKDVIVEENEEDKENE